MRRITVTLDIGLETSRDVSLEDIAGALVDELVMFHRTLPVPYEGVPVLEWPVLDVTAVALNRASEQGGEKT